MTGNQLPWYILDFGENLVRVLFALCVNLERNSDQNFPERVGIVRENTNQDDWNINQNIDSTNYESGGSWVSIDWLNQNNWLFNWGVYCDPCGMKIFSPVLKVRVNVCPKDLCAVYTFNRLMFRSMIFPANSLFEYLILFGST